MKENEIYTNKITKGARTYFFDIKKSAKDDLYLKISESKKTESGYEHHSLLIFEEDLKDFVEVFKKTLTKFKDLKEPQVNNEPQINTTYSVAKIREKHQQAYFRWSTEDDNKLELLFCKGKRTKELAEILGRNVGAINSRIKKLELKDKYRK